MSKGNSYSAVEKDCTSSCQSLIHGSVITSAITKRDVADKQLASYFSMLCGNLGQVKDVAGRTALHMAASCGRMELCHWLLKYLNADISARDKESQSTPLHRSLFYGQIHVAVLLIKAGANMLATDVDNLTCIDYAMKDQSPLCHNSNHSASEVYIWGSNSNYTHGTGNQQSRQQPELLDTFRKNNISIKQVCMDKFHSVFVSSDGRAWACGHGMGGRLGIDSESTVLTPQPIKTGSEVVQAASIGRDHTVLLMESGAVWTCGLNTHHQLGHMPAPKKLLMPRPLHLTKITKGAVVEGVAAARFHTVFWTENSIYTFGLHAGQLGHPVTPESTVITPRLVTSLSHNSVAIKHVATSDGATVVSVAKGDIYVLHEYQTRKIASKMLNVAKIVVSGGHLNAKADNKILMDQGGEDLQIVVLTTVGKIFIWLESVPQLTRCNFSIHRSIEITDVNVTRHQILLTTVDGEGFQGEVVEKSKKKLSNSYMVSRNQGSDKDDFLSIKLLRLPHLHRTISITSDPKGRNFAAIQVHPKAALTEIPGVGPSDLGKDMATLFMEASEQDSLHDIIFEVAYERFACHRYILRLNSELDIPYQNNEISVESAVPIVKIDNVNPIVFQQLLQFVYTGNCDIIHPGPCNLKIAGTNKTDPVRMALEAAKKYKISKLVKMLQMLKYDNSSIKGKDGVIMDSLKPIIYPPVLDHESHTDLYDVQITSSDGGVIKAHKCVLVARLEYFHSMLAGGWIETSATRSLKLQIPFSVLSDIIEFIYTDTVAKLHSSDDFEHICSVLIVADQLFVTHLKELCEVALSNNLNLRNASHLLQFAATYNCEQLKQCCMQFISLNLPAFLEMRTLEVVSPDVLKELSTYYKYINPVISHRDITPFADAVTDEEVISASELYSVAWEEFGDSELEEFDWLSNRITPLKQGKNSSLVSTSSSSGKKKRSHRMSTNEAQRKRYESVSSNSDLEVTVSSTNFDDVHEEPCDEWITVDKTQKSVQARLKVLVKASTIEPNPEDYVQLPLSRSTASSAINISNANTPASVTVASSPPPPSLDNTSLFPQLTNQVYSKVVMSSSPRSSNFEVKRTPAVKLSQKQRKKLAAESNVKEISTAVPSPASSVSAWGTIPPLSTETEFSLKNSFKDKSRSTSASDYASTVSPKSFPCLSDIVADEIKQKDNWSRMRTKSFHLTQIEDQAMESLLVFYNASNVFDERITVQRVPYGNVAKPIWITSKR